MVPGCLVIVARIGGVAQGAVRPVLRVVSCELISPTVLTVHWCHRVNSISHQNRTVVRCQYGRDVSSVLVIFSQLCWVH